MFYDKFKELCQRNGVAPSRVALDCGFSKGTVSRWKADGSSPQREILVKIADYFGVTVDYLLGNERSTDVQQQPKVTEDDIKFALFDGEKGISDEAYEEVKKFAQYIKEKYKK